MILRRCDKCKKDFTPALDYEPISIPSTVFTARRTSWRDSVKEYLGMVNSPKDLCPACAGELEELINKWLNA